MEFKDLDSYNKIITDIVVTADNQILLNIENQNDLRVRAKKLFCCENRYLNVEDYNYRDVVGQRLRDIRLSGIQSHPVIDGILRLENLHDVQFLDLITDQEVIQFSLHNVHSGVYTGFDCVVSEDVYLLGPYDCRYLVRTTELELGDGFKAGSLVKD